MPGEEEIKDFENSFDEAAGEGKEKAEAPVVTAEGEGKAPAEPIPGEEKKEAEGQAPAKEEPAKAVEKQAEEGSGAKAEEGKAEEAIPYEKLLQQKKSLEGMFNPLKAKLDQTAQEKAKLQEELEKLKANPPKAGEEPAKEKAEETDTTLGDEDANEALKTFREDFPDVSAGVKEEFKHAIAPVLKQIEELTKAVMPIAGEYSKSAQEKHFQEIRTAHNDYDQIIADEDIQNWILEQSPIIREAYVKTWDHGSAKDMIKLVSDYKQAKGISSAAASEKKEEIDGGTARKLADGEAVQTKRTAVSGGATAGKEDFEGAFSEAIRN